MKIQTKTLIGLSAMVFACGLGLGGGKVSARQAPYTLSVDTSGPITIDVQGDRENATVSSDDITVTTTCRSGYNFVISSSVNDNNLYLDGDETNNAAGTYFTPVDGTSTLASTVNSWGYYYDAVSTPTTASVFSAVPTLGNSAVIRAPLETPSETNISDSFSIYYGVSVSDTMKSGVYTMLPDTNANGDAGSIVYQATIADACMRYTVNFDPTDTYTGSAVTGTGTMASQSIYEGTATPLNSNTFTAPAGYEFIGWNTAQDGSGTTYANGASVTDLALAGESVTLYAMWSECANGICYQQNGENVEGTMGKQAVTADTAAPLLASNFSRSGYGFAGWSNVPDYETNPDAHFYGPMEDYTVPASAMARGVKLYAVWVESAGSLQDANKVAELCGTGANALQTAPTDGTANLSSVSALTDQRDNQTYAIAKLADGKCWMIENLRLEAEDSRGNNRFDPSVTNESLVQGYNSSFTGLADSESANFSSSTTANSLYTTGTGVEGKNTISGDNQGYRFPRYNNNNTSQRAESPTNTNVNTYSYGNYYTWAAVIADTTHYTSEDHNTTSICPKGWSIPQGNNTSAGFAKLDIDMGGTGADQDTAEASNRWRKYPANFLYSGEFYSSSASRRGSSGFYWSSTAYYADYSYDLGLGSTSVNPGTDIGDKYLGDTARCVLGQ